MTDAAVREAIIARVRRFFAIPALVVLVCDRENRHWTAGVDFDATIGAVNLLGSWGTDVSEVVPILTLVLDAHTNQWAFVLGSVRDLGAMAKEAEEAHPALR